ncbi:hypothetical protein GMMP15_940029 [Candidatus Magnetomoraceae bacterium gMMP-15]
MKDKKKSCLSHKFLLNMHKFILRFFNIHLSESQINSDFTVNPENRGPNKGIYKNANIRQSFGCCYGIST